ncbi:MAG: right-handed parallel beta-helix repeat-containing protein [Actinomycetota bacterium]|nr:right-handed parallel beta-helix repeat-containing protein [Actinomycetota bacterium]
MKLTSRNIGLGSVMALLALGSALATSAQAATVACGQVITQTTKLTADVGPCPGNGLILGADGITLDLGGHRVFGTAGPKTGTAAGIRLRNRTGVTIRNGSVTNFDAGVVVNRGSRNVITRLNVLNNLGPRMQSSDLGDGIVLMSSADNIIASNVVRNNGFFDGIGVLSSGADRNIVRGNLVENNRGLPQPASPPAGGYQGSGIGITVDNLVDPNVGGRGDSIHDNIVSGNIVRQNDSNGISSRSNANGVIVGNLVEQNGQAFVVGQCGDFAPGDGIAVFRSPLTVLSTQNVIKNNVVRSSRCIGILLDLGATDNFVITNRSTLSGYLDLADANSDASGFNCDHNVWRGNMWGPPSPFTGASFFPDCTAIGGNGPTAPIAAGASASATSTSSFAVVKPRSTDSPPGRPADRLPGAEVR